jgi:hypothetical protein
MEALENRQLLSITVNTLVDEQDNNITTDGDVSLRDAIIQAPAGATIDFDTSSTSVMNGGTIQLLQSLHEIADGKGVRNEWHSDKRKACRGKLIWIEKDLLEMVGVL